MTAKEWNEQYPPGTDVVVIQDDGSALITTTRSEAWDLGDGHPVVKVIGKTGGYSLYRVHPVALS